MASIGIILLNYNSTRLTKKCVQSLFAHKEKNDEYAILVFDNDSKHAPDARDFPDCELVCSTKNLGFAEGNNAAVRAVLKTHPDLEYLLLLNNDTRVTKGMVSALIAAFERTLNAGIVVPKIYFERGHEYHHDSYSKSQIGKVIWFAGGDIDWRNMIVTHRGVDEVDRGQFDLRYANVPLSTEHTTAEEDGAVDSRSLEFATGCCLLTTPEIWKKLKGFDPKYFLYYEDTDLSWRLVTKLHKKIVFEPRAELYHQNAGSTSGSGSAIHQYYQTRNRLRFGLQYAPRRTKIALLLEARRLFLSGVPAVKLGILDALGGKWGNQTRRIPQERPLVPSSSPKMKNR